MTGFAVLTVLLAFLTAAIGVAVLIEELPDFRRRRRRAKRIRDGLERRPAPPPPGASNDEVLAYMSELFGDRTGSEIMDDEELRAELFRLAREGRAAADAAGVTAAG
ncbi:MAG TPA: hypothetical protein VE596_01760 [Gaiellaceae bacterium]|nr:hypothetical protein [Gaiellaceae bacterium]